MTAPDPIFDLAPHPDDRLVPPAGAALPADLGTVLTLLRQTISRGDLQRARMLASAACKRFPSSAEAFHNFGVAEALLGNTIAAISHEEQALVRNPGLTEAEQNLVRLRARRTTIETILKNYGFPEREKAALDPTDRAALYLAIGHDLMAIGEATSATAFFQKSFSFQDPTADALVELGTALQRSDRLHDAINSFRRAIAIDPRHGAAIGSLIRALQDACLWSELANFRLHQQAIQPTLSGKAAVAADRPFANLHASEDPAQNRRAAERYSALLRARQPLVGPAAAAPAAVRSDDRLRIGYLSADFRNHPVGQLAASMLPRHDRARFEINVYSIGADDRSVERQAIEKNCDRFQDFRTKSESDIAETIAADGIQILVDLNGYTSGCRPGVMVLRPAPIQVWAIGFPGSSGSDFIDYIVADRTVLPPEDCAHFSEQPCWLPDTCQSPDAATPIATAPATRAELGLPDGFLFVSWQNPIKIEPRVFDLWMDILRTVPDSHLWLRHMPEYARRNLGIEAKRRQVDPDRLICATETARDKAHYLRNIGLADLALDTLTYNGQTTTSDLLRAGVPVIAMLGRHFAGRVAASLLQAANLSELVTYSPRAYRDLAVKLARDPARLSALRTRLVDLQQGAPLFDTGRYVRALERGYEAMWARHGLGEKPAPITVEIGIVSQALQSDSELRAAETLFHAGRHPEAIAACDRALAADPDHRKFLLLRAVLAINAGDATTGEARLRRLIALAPDDAQAQQNLGALLAMRGQLEDAVTHFQRALAAAPDDLGIVLNFARALRQLGRLDEAEKLLRRAADAHPTRAEPLQSLGLIAGDRHRTADAVAMLEQASARAPRSASILADLGSAYRIADRLEPALDAYRRALAIDPDDDVVPARFCHQLERACAWSEAEALRARLLALSDKALATGKRCAELPFAQLAYQDDPAKILRLARAWSGEIEQRAGPMLPAPTNDRDPTRRLRIGFLSHDFRSHAVSELARGVLADLDRSAFQVTAWSTGPDDRSALRRSIEGAVDEFRDIAALPHREAAQAIRREGTDILVDLTGHTAGSRLEIAALRPAPVQASWLGYPGTTGASFIDWLIADATVVPPGAEKFYSEAVCRLPGAYLPLDDAQPIAAAAPTRASQRLPEQGFVFCSFNNMHKIEPVMFGVWMDLLREVPGSVLWLHAYSDLAAKNLRSAASHEGIEPARLVFADRPAKAAHLARAGLAGLALDTRLYNGHTTTIDMLWAGVPVVTLPGTTFQARVSASLLKAADLPELIARDLDDYRRIALTLAREPARLSALKAKLAANRKRAPLFDTARFARKLETAFRTIWQGHCAGRKPAALDIGEAA